jgi:hypothetical protein
MFNQRKNRLMPGVWRDILIPPDQPGWYRVKSPKAVLVRAFFEGEWWIPSKGDWEPSYDSYAAYDPTPVRALEPDDSEIPLATEFQLALAAAGF